MGRGVLGLRLVFNHRHTYWFSQVFVDIGFMVKPVLQHNANYLEWIYYRSIGLLESL